MNRYNIGVCANSPGCEDDHCRCDDEDEQDRQDEIQEDTTSMEEKLEALEEIEDPEEDKYHEREGQWNAEYL